MEEVEPTGEADLLMECDEEEQKVWPQSPERGEEEGHDEASQAAGSPMEGEEEDPPPLRIIPIPVQPVSSCSPPPHNNTHNNTPTCSGAPLGFMVNGQLIPLQPGGGGAELKLRSHPKGSASGFTTVQIPVTVHSPAEHINTTAALTATSNRPPLPPPANPTPIITGVVSGEAAQRVLSNHNFRSSPPLPQTGTSPQTPSPGRTKRPPSSSTAPHKLLHKGQLGPPSPPDCLVCMSQYKLISELRGFLCLCSPLIAQSLKKLKKKNSKRRRHRDKNKRSSRASRTRPGLSASKVSPPHRTSDGFFSDQFPSPPARPTDCSPQQDQSESPPDPPHSKLVIMVEDFYYGFAPGRSSNTPDQKFTGPYRCIHCPKTLHNNIRLMSHMQQHVSTMSQHDGRTNSPSTCPYCFRHYFSPFKLQCHLEAVHSQYESTAKCKICELQFGSEADFLWHMKNTHKPGEMPYVCQVCDFRSSFHSDVWFHFHQVHADTKHLLCQYCLRVLRSSPCYQQHFARHQKKHVFSCDKCRLHFLYVKERIEHQRLHHRTHIRPPQLTGLKPGTKVTVRTYSVVGGSMKKDGPIRKAPLKVVDVNQPSLRQEAPKRKLVESLGQLLSKLSQESEAAGVSRPSQRCVECLSLFQDFRTHFPSLVHCSLCRFTTCCSTSYANHMINNHTACRKKPQYHNVFQSHPRLAQRLRCSCSFSTYRGDVMASHLTERPKHHCIMLTHTEPKVNGHSSSSVTSSVRWGGGAFIPIHLLSPGQTSTQLSVKPLTSPSPLSSPPAMTIKFLGPRLQPEQHQVCPLSTWQLSVVLFSLCHGVLQASQRFRTSPLTIRSWIQQQDRQLSDRKWHWRTEKVAEWLLSRREQQLSVTEDVLLQTARTALGEDSELNDRYSWTVDFMLRHELSLQPANPGDAQHHKRRLPRAVRKNVRAFSRCLSARIHGVPAHRVASMDEFPIFIDSDRFSKQSPAALQLFGSPGERPAFDIVLSALSDGTFLPPLLFFRGTPSHLPEGFPENVLLEARRKGFTDQERLQIWIDEVWRPRVAAQCHGELVLMLDVHRGHLTDEFRGSLASMSTDVIFIPSGTSCRLQPLDFCVTLLLRDFLQARWSQLVSQGGLDGLGLDQLALTLACWLSELSSTLNSETNVLRRSFAAVCNVQQQEDRQEAARMIQTLNQALIQPPPGPGQDTDPGPGPESEPESEPGPDPGPESDPEPESGPEPELLLLVEQEVFKSRVFDVDSDQESCRGFHDD